MIYKKTLVSILGLLIIPFMFGSSLVFAEEANFNVQETLPEVLIYDNKGDLIEPTVELTNNDLISPFAATAPTKVKYLNNSDSYQSNEFSASGRRFSGYTFTTRNTSKKFKLTFKKGGFGLRTHTWLNTPEDVDEYYNLPLSGSPYTIITSKYFYFVVDNPNKGQTYSVAAIK